MEEQEEEDSFRCCPAKDDWWLLLLCSWLAISNHNPPAGNRRETRASVGSTGTAAAAAAPAAPAVLLRLPSSPPHRALKHTCKLSVFRSCSKYACIPMFCKLRETTSCHIFTSLPCPYPPFLSFQSLCGVFSLSLCICVSFSCVFLSLPCDCLKQLSALTQRLFSTASLPLSAYLSSSRTSSTRLTEESI